MEDLNNYVIKNDFYNSIEEEITCSICRNIKVNPVMCTKCQNSFCNNCIEEWKKKSHLCPFKCIYPDYTNCRLVKNLLSKLTFKCKNNCESIIPYDQLLNHYDFECTKIDDKEKSKNLLIKYNKLQTDYNKLEKDFYELKTNFIILLDFKLDSNIISDNPNDLFFIKNSLYEHYDNKKIELELLYRASRDGDNPKKFHELCDNKEGGTLIIYKTDKNIIFGGFSNAKWISFCNEKDHKIGKDATGSINFLFQLNNKKKYYLRKKENNEKISAIYCRFDSGPCFGSCGEDIWVHGNFLSKNGVLHKDKDKGRTCSFDTKFDYELNNGESSFKIVELEVFLLK